jgi:two-component system sensor histidine kinase KdpD
MAERGHLKVFIGMAAGVGKTYRMLQEGQAEAEAGRDVVIGYLESHGRAETERLADGLEIVPRRRVIYRDTPLQEMNLPAILAREPELCLIDELAHTNAPGVEHEKRYEDVQDVLDAGIDVYSTVNIQHLETLNDQVTQLTGTRVRETIPDAVLSRADEVVLVDLTPEALIARLRAGKVYPAERVQAALGNFFKIENLSALRETALRQVAEGVEVKRLTPAPAALRGRREGGLAKTAAPQAISERLLALVTLSPRAQRVVRRAWRSAQRLGAELDLLVVRRPGGGTAGSGSGSGSGGESGGVRARGGSGGRESEQQEREALEALRRLASILGAHLLVEEGDDVADVAIRVARERGTTYVLMGAPKPRNAWRRLMQPALPFRLLRGLPGVDLRIVADRTLRAEAPSEEQGVER